MNIDPLDASGTLVASDTFQSLVAGTALSTLVADDLIPGTLYQLKLTGTAVGRGSYSLAIRPLPPVWHAEEGRSLPPPPSPIGSPSALGV